MNRVVVVGRDAPLWLAANVLATALKASGVAVDVVELPSRLRPQDVHVTQPALEALHGLLGLDEGLVLKATGAAFSLGQMFTGFSGNDRGFFHAYGSAGAPIAGQAFLPFWLKARALGLNAGLQDFSLTAQAALYGRMLIPDATTEAFARTDYGYHLPALPYAALLKGRAFRQGIQVHVANDVAAVRDGEVIIALDADGVRIPGDLFVDLTAEGVLIGRDIEPWNDLFPCDRVLTAAAPPFDSLPAYAHIVAHDRGWLGTHPSRAATHLIHTYSSAALSDEAALQLTARLSGLTLHDAAVRVSDPGRRTPWQGNCVAIGEAACRFDAIDGVDLHAVQLGLVHLLSLFPVDGQFDAERGEYNRIMQASFERIRDFQAAHYYLSRLKPDSPIPASLQAKIDGFAARGVVALYDEETFPIDSWHAILLGHGITPVSHDPRIDRVPGDEMKTQFRAQLAFIREQVEAQVAHDDYLSIFA